MRVIGLTGGIGMGKSTVGAMFARRGIPVFDADAAVHRMQRPGGAALPALAAAFPGTVADGVLDRAALRAVVFADTAALLRLEAIMHPLVRRAEYQFRVRAQRAGKRAVLLDIPLLFEFGAQRRLDATITVSAPRSVQVARVRRRRSMSDMQIAAIIAHQMPDAEKRRRADHVIRTGLSRFETRRQVVRLIGRLHP